MLRMGQRKKKKTKMRRGEKVRIGGETSASHVKSHGAAQGRRFSFSLSRQQQLECRGRPRIGALPAMMEKGSWLRGNRNWGPFFFSWGRKGVVAGREARALVSGVKGKNGSWLEREDGGPGTVRYESVRQ